MEEFHAVVLGAGGAGKSALTLRFMRNQFVDIYDPTIEESFARELVINGRLIRLDVLDTAGAEQFTAISEFYLRGADGFLLVFSLTAYTSFEALESIRQQVLRVKGSEMGSDEYARIPLIIVGTKSDLQEDRQVPLEHINRMRKTWDVVVLETSAKRNEGVTEAFHELLHQMMANRRKSRKAKNSSSPRSSHGHAYGHQHRNSEHKIYRKEKKCVIM